MRSRPILALALVLALTGCVPSGTTTPESPTAPTSQSPSPAPPSPTPSASSALTVDTPDFVERIVLEAPSDIAPGWSLLFTLPYGDAPSQLGTSLGGDGEGVKWGPSYGTQMPDGTWWFLDVAHKRLAQFDDNGTYLGEVKFPEKYLAGGEYVQYASPMALANGTLVLVGTTADPPALLLLSKDHSLRSVPLTQQVGLHYTDGKTLFGFDEAQKAVQVNPETGEVSSTSSFTTQDGGKFAIAVGQDQLVLDMNGRSHTFPVAAAPHPGKPVHPSIQVASGADGSLALFVAGVVELSESDLATVAGVVISDGEGRITAPESVPDPFSESDTGDGSRIGVRLGDSSPWLMLIGNDAVRVYRRG